MSNNSQHLTNQEYVIKTIKALGLPSCLVSAYLVSAEPTQEGVSHLYCWEIWNSIGWHLDFLTTGTGHTAISKLCREGDYVQRYSFLDLQIEASRSGLIVNKKKFSTFSPNYVHGRVSCTHWDVHCKFKKVDECHLGSQVNSANDINQEIPYITG